MVFDKKANILALREVSPNVYGWQKVGSTWVSAQTEAKTNLFSKLGIGAPTVTMKLRTMKTLTLHNALEIGGRFHFLSHLLEDGPLQTELRGVRIEPTVCRRVHFADGGVDPETKNPVMGERTEIFFPAVLTEKYYQYTQEKPMATAQNVYVLITGKEITVEASDVLYMDSFDAESYVVTKAYVLDEYKNEYEITREVDL